MFHDKFPTNKFLMPSGLAEESAVLLFLTTGSAASSALRFLEGASSSSLSESEESEESAEESSESEEAWCCQ